MISQTFKNGVTHPVWRCSVFQTDYEAGDNERGGVAKINDVTFGNEIVGNKNRFVFGGEKFGGTPAHTFDLTSVLIECNPVTDRKSTRLKSSHTQISHA